MNRLTLDEIKAWYVYKHVKTSGRYVITGFAKLQLDGPDDNAVMVVYRKAGVNNDPGYARPHTTETYVRKVDEFCEKFVHSPFSEGDL